MRKKILMVIILTASLIFTGCWDYIEYEDMAMVTAMGIDFDIGTKKITVTTEIVETGKSGGQGQSSGSGRSSDKSKSVGATIVLSGTDVTISDALAKLQQGSGKRLFFGYQEIIVISEDAAKNIMDDIVALLDRTPQIRSTAYLMITPQKCEDILGTIDPAITELSGRNIRNLVKMTGDAGNSSAISIKDFVQAMAVGGIEAVAPRIITENSGITGEQSNTQNGSNNSQPIKFVKSEEGHHVVDGIAAFREEKFAGWLNAKESLGWSWITGKRLKTYKTTKSSDKASSEEIADYRISKSKSSIKPEIHDDKPVIEVNVGVKVTLVKGKQSSDLLTPDELNLMQKELSDSIRNDIETSLKRAQKELKTDIFGFGFAFYRKYPGQWHSRYEGEWDRLFPDIPIIVNVDAKVINTGTTIRRFITK